MLCATCFSPIRMTFWGPVGYGVCRDDHNPNGDDEGQHIAIRTLVPSRLPTDFPLTKEGT